jgi:hypothetical protein
LRFGLNSREFWDSLKSLADRLKVAAEFLTALILLLGAVAGFWPEISAVVTRVAALFAAAPWWLKYIFLVLAVSFSFWLYLRQQTVNEYVVVLASRLALTISDKEGKRATLKESTHIRAKINDLDSYLHRQGGEGQGGVPKIWAEGYLTSVKSLGVQEGLESFALQFDPPLRRGMKLWQHYECELADTFLGKKEFLQHRPHYREREYQMEVFFPRDRLPSKVRALLLVGETIRVNATLKPTTDKDGNEQVEHYIWQIGRTTPDRRYRIEWEW